MGAVPGAVIPGSPRKTIRSARGRRVRALAARIDWYVRYVRDLRAWGTKVAAVAGTPDVWHVHDFTTLAAVGRYVPDGALLIYDVHDVFVETGSAVRLPSLLRSMIQQFERRSVRRADLVVTVNDAVADILKGRLSPRRIVVVHNCPPRWDVPAPRPTLLADAMGVGDGIPIVLYHGLLAHDRGIETLIDAMREPGMESAHLALMGYGPLRDELLDSANDPDIGGRIHVLPAVTPDRLLRWVASADVGAMAMPASTINLIASTPNKLFECLAAGTPVVVGPYPAVRSIAIDDALGPFGLACDPSQAPDVARALRSILELPPARALDLRSRCKRAALERWELEREGRG